MKFLKNNLAAVFAIFSICVMLGIFSMKLYLTSAIVGLVVVLLGVGFFITRDLK